MSPRVLGALLWPPWLQDWLRYQFVPALGLQPRTLLLGVWRGASDALLFILLVLGALLGSRLYMAGQYTLPPAVQSTVLQWAAVADIVARQADVPREVPLVIWYKENSLQRANPDNCTGIIGAYDLVRSGALPCFAPGPITGLEIARQLALAAAEFKSRCPDIHYYSQDPALIKRCYFAYNAGVGAAARLDPDESAYVMNDFDEAHRQMLYREVELGTVRVTSLGAWPAHLAFQSLIAGRLDLGETPAAAPFLDASLRIYDRLVGTLWRWRRHLEAPAGMLVAPNLPTGDDRCLESTRLLGRPGLRPSLNPVAESPLLTQPIHGCAYGLAGVDISSRNPRSLLLAPMPGRLTTYTDQWQNTTIRLENDEWIVWLLHPRSYRLREGEVKRGDVLGVMGAIGYATGPHVHYAVYDRLLDAFVNPLDLLP